MAETTSERREIGFSLKLSPGESKFLDEFRAENAPGLSLADTVRDYINAFRTWFSLPPYMVAVLKKDLESRSAAHGRKLHQREYIQEILAMHYERLTHGDQKP